HTAIFPWVGHPGYNLTTDMADEAIKYLKEMNATAPDKPFFLYYVPGGTHAPHHPNPEWIKKISDMHLFDGGWDAVRRSSRTRNGSGSFRPGPSSLRGRIVYRSGIHLAPTRRNYLYTRQIFLLPILPTQTMRLAV